MASRPTRSARKRQPKRKTTAPRTPREASRVPPPPVTQEPREDASDLLRRREWFEQYRRAAHDT